MLQTELAVIHPPLPLEKRAQIIGPPVHSVSISHTCTNTYKVTNTQQTHTQILLLTHTHTPSRARTLAHTGLVKYSQNFLPPATESEGTSLCRKGEMKEGGWEGHSPYHCKG